IEAEVEQPRVHIDDRAQREQRRFRAAGAAAAADALGEDAGGLVALSLDAAGFGDGDGTAHAAGRAVAADGDSAGESGVAVAALAAAAADALGEDAVGTAALGDDIAGVGDLHQFAVAGVAARAADGDGGVLQRAGLAFAADQLDHEGAGEGADVAVA